MSSTYGAPKSWPNSPRPIRTRGPAAWSDPTHSAADDATLALVDHARATHIAVQNGCWFDPNKWDIGEIPSAQARVLVPFGRIVSYDGQSPVPICTIRVDGTLAFSTTTSSTLVVDTVIVSPQGVLTMGTGQNPLAAGVTIDVMIKNNGEIDIVDDPQLLGRGIVWLGEFTSFAERVEWSVRTAPANLPSAGDTSVTLTHAPGNWAVGMTVVIPGTATDIGRRDDDKSKEHG